MPTILSLDTSTEACSVAIELADGQVVEKFELAAKSHTQRLLPMVDELLSEQGLVLKDLDAIAFSAGPGSFTGIRIGMGVVQGLAFAGNIPVLPISTLHALAWQGVNGGDAKYVLSALDARMGEVYFALYEADDVSGELVELVPATVCDPEKIQLPDTIASASIKGIGQGFQLDAMAQYVATFDASAMPRASAVARLAAGAYKRGEAQNIMSVELNYIRDTVTWKKRERIRS